ncbi:MAG TPA: ABC transporter permease [Trinickia sp.]|jgi:NitT/TauT family transport system permease protein|uniref:ABC transporter permease n=1 Tax=Trinickia sp. TaxID=2571163 RepID=UPI002C404D05|nr:ABC transporter permease [Trinickia sp.]HTI16488.1 ABC transporter permease [Trinickia sp.]
MKSATLPDHFDLPHTASQSGHTARSAQPVHSADVVPLPQTAQTHSPHSNAAPAAGPAQLTAAPPRATSIALRRLWRKRRFDWLLATISIASMIAFWYIATRFQLSLYVRFANIPTPGAVFEKLLEVNHTSTFIDNIAVSLRRILIGFSFAAVLGVTLGLLVGRYRIVRGLIFPALEALRPIPAIAWVPISVMLWPSNEVSIDFITCLGAFFPILLNTVEGVHAVDKVLLRAARSLGASEAALFRHVVLPGALPHIFTGLALGMGVAWVSLIAAEMISGQFGIGYATWEAYSLVTYSEIVLGMITIGLLGWLCSSAIRIAGTLAMPWRAFATREGKA